jgi:ATP-dependent metalloprotease
MGQGKSQSHGPVSYAILTILAFGSQDRIVMGAERRSQYIDEKNKLMTAYHEVRYTWQLWTGKPNSIPFTGRSRPCGSVHGGCYAVAQSDVCSTWSRFGCSTSSPCTFLAALLQSLCDLKCSFGHQTSLLPADDRLSVTLKEYLAVIDVMLGGRVAENLSELLRPSFPLSRTNCCLECSIRS